MTHIITVRNGDRQGICELTDPNKSDYAYRHGYRFIPVHLLEDYQSIFFYRYECYHEWLLGKVDVVDWLFCCDADFIFTNFDIPIESLVRREDCVVIAKDALMIQAGAFIVGNTGRGRVFLKAIAAGKEAFNGSPGFDQPAIAAYLKHNPTVARIVPQRTLQGYEYSLYRDLGGNYLKGLDADGNDGQWQRGDFGFHCPGAFTNKLEILEAHLTQVQR